MDTVLEPILKRDRWLITAGLLLIIIISWAYILAGAGMGMTAIEMSRMSADMLMTPAVWTPGYALLMFFMWWVMMIAMMLPSATPVILLAAALNRRSDPDQLPYGAAGYFTAGYLLIWAGFSLVAVAVQWLLQISDVLSGMLAINSAAIAAGLLLAAAIWQVTPLKQACLRQCRSPVKFLTERRRSGNAGALLMGLDHGLYCLGCCWFLMALLFVGGVMNLFWILGLTIFVLMEKLLPLGRVLGYIAAAILAPCGVLLLFTGSG